MNFFYKQQDMVIKLEAELSPDVKGFLLGQLVVAVKSDLFVECLVCIL